MRKFIILPIMVIILSGLLYAEVESPVIILRESIDAYNKTLFNRKFSNQDALEWWKISDHFVLYLLNNELKGENFTLSLAKYDDQKIGNVKISVFDTKIGSGVSFYYTFPRPPEGLEQRFSIGLLPLKADNSVYMAQYEALWIEDANPHNPPAIIYTFRILEKNRVNGNYEIIERFENTNLYKKVITAGKIKYRGNKIKPAYQWNAILDRDSIQYSNGAIHFDTRYIACPAGWLCYQNIYVSWVYANGKLVATQYREVDPYANYDEKSGNYLGKDITVKLSP